MSLEDEDEVLRSVLPAEKLKQSTTLLLELKKGMMEDFNVKTNVKSAEDITSGKMKVKRSTREKADKVRVYLEFYYSLVEKYSTPPPDSQRSGVDDVYNPLQVIRNRKIRKKYGEKTRDFHLARPPIIAIRDFSHRSSKFPWFVDIMEKSNDLIWRTNHWDELKRPDGKLWFGDNALKKDHHRAKRSGSSVEAPTDVSSVDSWARRSRFDRLSRTPGSRSETRENRNSRSLLSRFSTASSKKPEPLDNASLNDPKIVVPKIVYETPADDAGGKSALLDVAIDPLKKHVGVPEPPSEFMESKNSSRANMHSYSNSNVSSSWIHSNVDSSSNSYPVTNSNSNNTSNFNSSPATAGSVGVDEATQLTNNILIEDYKTLKTLQCSWELLRRKKMLTEFTLAKHSGARTKVIMQEMQHFKKEVQETEWMMWDYDTAVTAETQFLAEWKSKFLTDYSNRINSLISFSDRFLSDINTTLTLRVKILQENIDKMSLISNVKNRAWKKFMYKGLELFIVSCLWMVWFIFSTLRGVQYIMIVILKVLKWAFF